MQMRIAPDEKSLLFQILEDLFARLKAVHAFVNATVFIDLSIRRHDIDLPCLLYTSDAADE